VSVRAGLIIALVAGAAPALAAQEALLPSTGWGMGVSVSAWHFSTPVPQSGGGLADIAEVAIPFRVRTVFGRWSFDLSGAGAAGAAHFQTIPSAQGSQAGPAGDEGGDRLVSIYGPTDLKLRLTGPLVGDNLLFTAGVNLPTGKVALNADETSALQAIGAPAVRMPVGAFGTGTGFTLGLIKAFEGDDWAVALGASVEQRTEYSPIALLLSSGKAETKVTPGTAAHLTVGLDRPLGESRLSLLLVGDVFSKDKVRLGSSAADGSNDYTLGPQVTATTRIDFATTRWRESSLSVAARMRTAFSDSSGTKVSGSDGTYLEGALSGVLGGAYGAGLIVGVDARWHSGLKFTDAMVGAATTAAGVTLGVERAGPSSLTRFFLHGQYGTFDTGTTKATGFGAILGLSVSARREAR
jgi:hypothetical protein